MKLMVRLEYVKSWKGKYFEDKFRYHNEDRLVEIDANFLTEKQVDHLLDCAKKNPKHDGARALVIKINSYRAVRANPTGHKITKLDTLPAAVKAYMEKAPNKWLFKESADGYPLPHYVVSAEYHPRHDQRPAYVHVNLLSERRGYRKSATMTFHRSDLGKTVAELFNEEGYFLETEAAVNIYWEDITLLKKWSPSPAHNSIAWERRSSRTVTTPATRSLWSARLCLNKA